jgi:hypothetical protein
MAEVTFGHIPNVPQVALGHRSVEAEVYTLLFCNLLGQPARGCECVYRIARGQLK